MYTNYYNLYGYNRRKFNLASLKKIDFNKILNGTSKTLNVINQAIPIYYQVKPIITNAKTFFKVANIIKNDTSTVTNVVKDVAKASEVATGNPTFFL